MARIDVKLPSTVTVFATRLNSTAAWSRLWAQENICELIRCSGPHRCKSRTKAHSLVLAFLRPWEMIARRVPWTLS
jgi:hypothetical protein